MVTLKAQRARSAEQKDARRLSIVTAAAARLDAGTAFDDVTVAAVAQTAGIAKGTAYSYFSSKEALFLAVLEYQLERWLLDLDQFARQLTPAIPENQARIVDQMSETLAAQPQLLGLLAKLHHQLEANVSLQEIAQFKQFLLQTTTHTGAALEQACGMPSGAGVTFLLRAHALAIGLGQVATPAPVVLQLMQQQPQFQMFEVTFADEFKATLSAILRALTID